MRGVSMRTIRAHACVSYLCSRSFLAILCDKMIPGEGSSCAMVLASEAPPPMELPLVYVLSADEKEKVEAFINRTDFEMPVCMTDFYVFTSVRPHCHWCPALEGPKDEHGEKNECVRPCQKACTTTRARIDISPLLN